MNGDAPNQEIIRQFLMTYRRTPNPNVPEGKSPAEVFIGRSIRSKLDLIRPTKRSDKVNERMKDQFDKRNGTKDRWFSVGDQVYYRAPDGPNRFQWLPAVITGKKGRVMFEIEVNKKKQRAHANQLRKNAVSQPPAEKGDKQLPLDLLLDTFDLDRNNQVEIDHHPEVDQRDMVIEDNPMMDYAMEDIHEDVPVMNRMIEPEEELEENENDLINDGISEASTPNSSPFASAPTSPQPSPVKQPAAPLPTRPKRATKPIVRLDIDPSKKTYAKETKQ